VLPFRKFAKEMLTRVDPIGRPVVLPRSWLSSVTWTNAETGFESSIDEFMAFRNLLFVRGTARHNVKRIVAVVIAFGSRAVRVQVAHRTAPNFSCC
jgi:hypothetical protein